MENFNIDPIYLRLLLGTLGILIYALWKIRDHLTQFSPKRLFQDNVRFWIWAILMLLFIWTVVLVSPESTEAVKALVGLDVAGEPGSFLMLGWSLSALINNLNAKKIQEKKEGITV